MTIDLPIINKGVKIGSINLQDNSIVIVNDILFKCENRIDCCSNLTIPVTEFDIERIDNFEIDQIVSDMSPRSLLYKCQGKN